MSILNHARKALARLKSERNGHTDGESITRQECEKSEISEISPNGAKNPGVSGGVASGCREQECEKSLPYLLVVDQSGLSTVTAALDNTAIVGLDLETTGLDPRADRARLVCLSVDTIDGGLFPYLIDCFAVDPSPLWVILSQKELTIHNAAFDLAFLSRLGFTPGTAHDTMLMARALAAGGPDFRHCSLKDCA